MNSQNLLSEAFSLRARRWSCFEI